MSILPFPRSREDELEDEVKMLREQVRIIGALHLMERFHAFDAISDDMCPCCSSPVKVNRTNNSVMLEPR